MKIAVMDNNTPVNGQGVFDVNEPARVSPGPTSRPIIVGHHPQMIDPMVAQRPLPPNHPAQPSPMHPPMPPMPAPTAPNMPAAAQRLEPIQPPADVAAKMAASSASPSMPKPASPAAGFGPTIMSGEPLQSPAFATPFNPNGHSGTGIDGMRNDTEAQEQPNNQPAEHVHLPAGHVNHHQTRRWPIYLVIILVVLFGIYLLLDSGIISNNLNLPFHIFKS